jgi:hypothetical protein
VDRGVESLEACVAEAGIIDSTDDPFKLLTVYLQRKHGQQCKKRLAEDSHHVGEQT